MIFVLVGCGGRSDEDAYAPRLPDAAFDGALPDRNDVVEGAADTSADAVDAFDASSIDVSLDAGDGSRDGGDASRDAAADARPVDGSLDAADGRPDVVVRDASDGSTRVLVSIAVAPPAATLTPGTRISLAVVGTYSDATTADLTATATFDSLAPGIASVANNVVTAVAPGTSTITARVAGLLATAAITVSPTTVVSIAITPPSPSAGVGGSVSFTAVATLSDGNHQDVTASATWSSSNPSIATVSQGGLGRAVGLGVATIRATVGMTTGTASFTVISSPLLSIAVTPTLPTVPVGVALPFAATATYADGSIADVTSVATWASSSPDSLTVAAGGAAKTIASGHVDRLGHGGRGLGKHHGNGDIDHPARHRRSPRIDNAASWRIRDADRDGSVFRHVERRSHDHRDVVVERADDGRGLQRRRIELAAFRRSQPGWRLFPPRLAPFAERRLSR